MYIHLAPSLREHRRAMKRSVMVEIFMWLIIALGAGGALSQLPI